MKSRPVCPLPSLAVTYRHPDIGEITAPIHLGRFEQGQPALPDGTLGPPEWFLVGVDPRFGGTAAIPVDLIVKLGDWDG